MSENKRGPLAVIVAVAGAVLGTIELFRTANEFFESGDASWWLVLFSTIHGDRLNQPFVSQVQPNAIANHNDSLRAPDGGSSAPLRLVIA
jgi:hypothetical protein